MRVILDTNIILISIPRLSPYRPIIDAVFCGQLQLGVSTEIIFEYEELITRNISPTAAFIFLRELENLQNVWRKNIHFNWRLIPNDPDDNKYVDCAVAFSADYLVTEDKHFAVLKKVDFPKINVINADQFLEILKQTDPT
jgi:putative PIN family toxin of toxin-antitoxin system